MRKDSTNEETPNERSPRNLAKVVNERRTIVQQMLVVGKERKEIIAYGVKHWGLSEATMNDYVKEANRKFRQQSVITPEQWVNFYVMEKLDTIKNYRIIAESTESDKVRLEAEAKAEDALERLLKRMAPPDYLQNLKESGVDKAAAILGAIFSKDE